MKDDILTAVDELIITLANKITDAEKTNVNFIKCEEINTLATLIAAKANYEMSIRYYSSGRNYRNP